MKNNETLDNCRFCNLLRKTDPSFPEFFSNLRYSSQILFNGKEIVVLPDISPLSEGHLLILSKDHYYSWSQVSVNAEKEVERFIEKANDLFYVMFPNEDLLLFEHGPGQINGKLVRCGSCLSIDHAHLHLLPIKRDEHLFSNLISRIEDEFHLETIRMLTKNPIRLLKTIAQGKPYFFVFNYIKNEGSIFIKQNINTYIPPQFLRMLIASTYFNVEEEDISRWVWQNYLKMYTKDAERRIIDTISKWKSLDY